MNNKTKGLIAGTAGIALLLGGSTFALWSADADLAGGKIVNGNLDVALVDGFEWYDVSNSASPVAINASNFRMVPGDTLEGTQELEVAFEGDNLAATFNVTGVAASSDHVSVTYTVYANGVAVTDATDIAGGTPASVTLSSAQVGKTKVSDDEDEPNFTVVVDVAFDGDPVTGATERDQALAEFDFSALNVEVAQTR